MNYLTVEQVLFLHARLIEEAGGSHGVRDVALLESAVARPFEQGSGGAGEKRGAGASESIPAPLHPSTPAPLHRMAAALMHPLIRNHPFVDGNKRTGIAAAALFLRQNGRRLTATNPELEAFTLYVAESGPDIPEIADWLQTHSTSVL